MCDKLRVLVVDDDRYVVLLMRRLLGNFECDIRTCQESNKAVQIVQEFRPHVIFLDIQMPGLDGFEVAEDLHELNLRDNLLVAMTIYSDEAHQREAQACGFDLFLPKPPALEETANAIETARERFLAGQRA
jgi:two-component system, chemotaxis family, CheB/CheR fusion protein